MSLPLTRKSTDHSDKDKFSFSFFCDCCGKEWASQTMTFMAGGFTNIDHEEARQMLWAHEHKAAFERANLEATLKFNRCPLCGRWVCNDCFDWNEPKHGGVCKDCS